MKSLAFTLSLACDNAAFDDGNINYEISRILREVADKIESGEIGKARDVRDINGNVVGQFALMPMPGKN